MTGQSERQRETKSISQKNDRKFPKGNHRFVEICCANIKISQMVKVDSVKKHSLNSENFKDIWKLVIHISYINKDSDLVIDILYILNEQSKLKCVLNLHLICTKNVLIGIE